MKITFKSDTKKRKRYFTPEHFTHPAKMHLGLALWIIGKYTQPGDLVLDPMAGAGTTMVACTLGRDVVLVDLEEKFVKMAQDNWDKVKDLPHPNFPIGDCQIIQGDARNLAGILADVVISSPPFQEQKVGGKQGAGKYSGTDLSQGLNRVKDDYVGSKNPNNVGNLPYSNIDKIITSPPYASGGTKADENPENYIKREEERLKLFPNRPKIFVGRYSGDRDNIGNLPYGEVDKIDAVISSPPYEGSLEMGSRHTKGGIPGRDKKLGQTGTYEQVDKIVTSPPYEGSISGIDEEAREREKEWLRKQGKNPNTKSCIVIPCQYSSGRDNIGNFKSDTYLQAMLQVYQQCYQVLKPNGLMILVTKDFIRNKQRILLSIDTLKLCEQAGFVLEDWHERVLTQQSFWRTIYYQKYPEVERIETEDILVLRKPSGGGEIDAIVTSPPYEEAMGKKHHSPVADRIAKEKRLPQSYTGRGR